MFNVVTFKLGHQITSIKYTQNDSICLEKTEIIVYYSFCYLRVAYLIRQQTRANVFQRVTFDNFSQSRTHLPIEVYIFNIIYLLHSLNIPLRPNTRI